MSKTVAIQIGNSDDKLAQREWSEYWAEIETEVMDLAVEKHFCGGSGTINPWQNFCWVIEIEESNIQPLVNRIRVIREKYRQDSVAVLSGDTQFV
jgi:hypothetical protein